ncbi:MAG: shikimate dehydrogenase [Gemmatimonadota bacterium]
MTVRVTASTRLLALLGDPVGHSLSPVIQNAAFRAAGVDGVYVALRCGEDGLSHLLRGLSEAGGGGNVTLPHKERAASVVTAPTDAVRRTGACNTFWAAEGRIHGDNTDVEGFRRALDRFLGRPPEGYRVLLLGAGGAARAVLVGLLDDDAREVVIVNRSTERARAVARRIGDERVRVADDTAAVFGGSFDLVINATRLGLDPDDPLPLDLDRLDRAGAVLDLLYGARKTAFVRAAERYGVRATDGAEMLVQQGAVAFERWWGGEAPVEAMRAAMEEGRQA